MVDAITTALNGLNAAYQRFDISANKIASGEATPTVVGSVSANTPFIGQTGQATNSPTDTVNTSIRSVTPATIAGSATGSSGTNANAGQPYAQNDTAQQLINANISSYDAQGNLAVIKTANKTFQALINIVS